MQQQETTGCVTPFLAAATAIEPGVIQVGEGAFAYAGCSDPAAVISEIILPAYGNLQLGCNSTLSYM